MVWCQLFGITAGTARVALHRMTTAGELARTDAGYELVGALALRDREQRASLTPRLRRWNGGWRMAIAVGDARPAGVRADVRAALRRSHLAEWREGVWIRPANVDIDEDPRCAWLDARPDGDPFALAAELFSPALWRVEALTSTTRLTRATQALRDDPTRAIAPAFLAGAAALRHVRADPQLPDALLPHPWPGETLRREYVGFQREFDAAARAWFRAQ